MSYRRADGVGGGAVLYPIGWSPLENAATRRMTLSIGHEIHCAATGCPVKAQLHVCSVPRRGVINAGQLNPNSACGSDGASAHQGFSHVSEGAFDIRAPRSGAVVFDARG